MIPPKLAQAYANAVAEALALYGARHWQHYHALLTLSDAIGFKGIKHHQSSDDRGPDDSLTNPTRQLGSEDLLSHEFLVEQDKWFGTYSLNDHGGLHFPHLERIKGTPDMLAAIMAPHRPKEHKSAPCCASRVGEHGVALSGHSQAPVSARSGRL